jgi:hypothetical protein
MVEGSPIRCIAKKNNGTQCKCVAMIGFNVCGTHRSWDNLVTFDKPTYVHPEDVPYVPKYVPTPVVKKGSVNELFAIMGR